MRLKLSLALLVILCTACGTFNLGNVHPQISKTHDQQQLDTLTCKDRAHLEASSGGRQAGAFLLGMTIVGAPLAFELDKAKQREVFTTCMHERGYDVSAAKD